MIGSPASCLRAFRLPGIRRDLGTTTISNVLTLVLSGLVGVIIARALGPASRGEYAAVVAWFGFSLIAGQFGQTAAVTYYVSRYREQARDFLATSRTLLIVGGMVTLGAGLAAAPLLASGNTALLSGYRLMFVTCLASFAGAGYTFSLQATDIQKWNLVRLSQPILFAAGVSLLHATGGLTLMAVLTVLAVTVVAQTALSYCVCHRAGLTGGRTRRALARPLTRYGLSNTAAALPSALVARLDLLILSLAVTPAALGQYAVAVSLTALVVPLVSAIGSVAFPRIAARGQGIDNKKLQRWALLGSFLLATGTMLPLVGLASWIVPAVFGHAYADAVLLVVVLAPAGVFLSCGRVCEDLLSGYGRPLTVARIQLSCAALAVLLLAVLVPAFGVTGAAAASSTAAATSLLLLLRALRSPVHRPDAGGAAASSSPAADATTSAPGPVHVALLVDHAAHYFAPAFRALQTEARVSAKVYFWHAAQDGVFDEGFGRHVRWSTDLHSGYDWWCPPAAGGRIAGGIALLRRLSSDRPQVVLAFGWASLPARLGILFAIGMRIPLVFYGDTNGRVASERRHAKLRRRLLRRLFAAAAGAIDTGVANRILYSSLGISEDRIYRGVLPVDVDAFARASARRRTAAATTATRPLVIAYVGKFLSGKAPDDLIHAVARLKRDGRWVVWLVGDGPTRTDLKHLVDQYGLTNLVRFLGFRNSDETPDLMAASDVLVLPSRRESRGLVAVEALAAGAIPVVSSATGVWGPGDAVEHGLSGLVYPVGDTVELAACLQLLIDDAELRERLKAEGQTRAALYGPLEFASTAAAALVDAASGGVHVVGR